MKCRIKWRWCFERKDTVRMLPAVFLSWLCGVWFSGWGCKFYTDEKFRSLTSTLSLFFWREKIVDNVWEFFSVGHCLIACWSIDWLIDWLLACLIDWLIDWFFEKVFIRSADTGCFGNFVFCFSQSYSAIISREKGWRISGLRQNRRKTNARSVLRPVTPPASPKAFECVVRVPPGAGMSARRTRRAETTALP